MKTIHTLCSTLLLTSAALIASSGASAADRDTERRLVSYADLNLNSAAGIETLYGRIRAAARSVCGSLELMQPLVLDANRECARDSLAAAVATVDLPALTAYHAQQARKGSIARIAASSRS